MYHKRMNIKHSLFISNIRIIVIAFAAFGLTVRSIGFFVFGTGKPDAERIANIASSNHDMLRILWILGLALFVVLISVINNYYTHRMTKRIIKSLEPLNEGVQQIHNSNFAYRIDYQKDDEFKPICEAFNEMAVKLESSAVQKQKDEANRKELIAGISHDLRTPLTSIKGYVEGLDTGVASTDDMRNQYLAIIKNKTGEMEHILEQLFMFSKLDMNEFPLTIRTVEIGPVISDIIEDSVSEYALRGLALNLGELPDNTIVKADVFLLRNVIINILENSVKYKTKDAGKIDISASLTDNSVLMRFADNGPGVDTDMLSKLFDVFYRTDPSRSRHGSGLGLAISKKIIERMGGSIYAELPQSGGLAIMISLELDRGTAI